MLHPFLFCSCLLAGSSLPQTDGEVAGGRSSRPSGGPRGLELQRADAQDTERRARRSRLAPGRDGIHDVAPRVDLGSLTGRALPPVAPRQVEIRTPPERPAGPLPRFDLSIDRDRVHVLREVDGIWLRGATFKARVADGGFTYIPFLGSDVPTTYPLEMTLTAATLAGGALDLGATRIVEPTADRFTIERGELEVRYDLRGADTIEQTVALEAAGATGDLGLEFDVATELLAVPEPSGAIRFEAWSDTGELLGGVRYGEATVLDGAGRSAPMTTEWSADRLRLTVPADFLREAEGTIVVDPLLSTFTVACDLYHALFDADRTTPNTNTREVVSRRMELAPGFPFDPVQSIGTTGNYDDIDPEVASGGSLWPGDVAFVVTWIRDFSTDGDVRYQTVDGAGDLGPVRALESSPTIDTTLLSIAKRSTSAGSPPTAIPIAWGERDIASGLWSLEVALISSTGLLAQGPETAKAFGAGARSGELDVGAPYFETDNAKPWALVFDPYDSTDEDVNLIAFLGTDVLAELDLTVAQHVDVTLDQAEPRIDMVDEVFCVTYLEAVPGAGGWRGYVQDVGINHVGLLTILRDRTDVGEITDGPVYLIGGGIEIARDNSFGSPGRWGALGWATNVGGEVDASGGLFDPPSLGEGIGVQFCLGEINSTGQRGLITCSGQHSSTALARLYADRLPPSSIGFFIVGDAMVDVPMAGGSAGTLCTAGNLGRYSGSILNSGSSGSVDLLIDFAAIPQPGGIVSTTPGTTWNFSYWHRDAAGGMTTSNFTNAVSVFIGS